MSFGHGEHDVTMPCDTRNDMYCGEPMQSGKQLDVLMASLEGSLVLTEKLDVVTGVIRSIEPMSQIVVGLETLPA